MTSQSKEKIAENQLVEGRRLHRHQNSVVNTLHQIMEHKATR